jgi:histidine triad (HIT) family protein
VRSRDDCIFCQIVSGQAPSFRVAEDDLALSFMDLFPVTDGHTLVISKDHAENVFEMEDAPMRAVAGLARRVAGALRSELAPDGLAVYQANGAAAGQTVWHYHVHLIPRRSGEGMLFHGRARGDDARLAALAGALARRLAAPD